MKYIIKPGTNYDFVGKTKTWLTISGVAALLSLIVIFTPGLGIKFGLDFSGGHEMLLAFDKEVTADQVRAGIKPLALGDTSVQSYQIPGSPKTHYLVRVQRTTSFGEQQIQELTSAFQAKYGELFKAPLRYNPEIGDVIEFELAASSTAAMAGVDTSTPAIASMVEGTGHQVRKVQRIGRPDQHRYAVALRGVDATVVGALKPLDPSVDAVRVEFVGPTVGKQLRDDGILACFYALLLILLYIALRFDFFYSPGGVICLFHDALITTGILVALGEEFSLTTIAGLLTLIGFSINDTIVIFDRIRETAGKAHGEGLKQIVNKSLNETLNRTIGTTATVLFACIALIVFGQKTVLAHYGLIMGIGCIVGSYSTIYIAAPVFLFLRERYGQKDVVATARSSKGQPKAGGAAPELGSRR